VPTFPLTPEERLLLKELTERKVKFLVAGVSAAVIEGAPLVTKDIDLWIEELGDPGITAAAKAAGGFYSSGWGIQPPRIGGPGLERIDLVLTPQGLDDFETENARAHEYEIDGLQLRVLPIERVIVSKRKANRLKDVAVLPALEATLVAKDSLGRAGGGQSEKESATPVTKPT
jgi:predicted nucleotidyltransferase